MSIRQDLIKGLRKFADCIEQNPELNVPDEFTIPVWIYSSRDVALLQMSEYIKMLGGKVDKGNSNGSFFIKHHFSPNVSIVYYCGTGVCERVQVGTRVVPGQPAREAQPERIVPEYEYKCPDILKEAKKLRQDQSQLPETQKELPLSP